jgi:oxygen-dependent protoporphyrinogen oxidase
VHVVVVGGGIAGLAAAHDLARAPGVEVTLLEADDRLGGKVRTEPFAGLALDTGPDAFLARRPEGVALCHDLGLDGALVAPATTAASLWVGPRLHPLPSGTLLGVPTDLAALARSRVLSPLGLARAAVEPLLPGRPLGGEDAAVGTLVRRRFGREAAERLIDPLVGGINAGRADALSLAATAPAIAAGAARSRSLALGLRRAPTGPGGPVFLGLKGGLHRLVDRLAEDVTDVRLGARVVDITATDGAYRLSREPGPDIEAEGVLVTVPAFAAAVMLATLSPAAAERMDRIRHASVVTATLAYRPSAVVRPLEGAGMLVPRVEGRFITACTWSTTKWPALAACGMVLLRASAGRDGDTRAIDMSDDDVVRHVHRDLVEALDLREDPVDSLVSRWPRGFPQYGSGHQRTVDGIEAALTADAPGVLVAGASYRGLGIAACVEQARRAATRMTA